MIDFLQYIAACVRAYRNTPPNTLHYFGLTRHNVPFLTVIIGRDRAAWQVTQLALEHQLTHAMFRK